MSTFRLKQKMSAEERKLQQTLDDVQEIFGVRFLQDEDKAIEALVNRAKLEAVEKTKPEEKKEPSVQFKR